MGVKMCPITVAAGSGVVCDLACLAVGSSAHTYPSLKNKTKTNPHSLACTSETQSWGAIHGGTEVLEVIAPHTILKSVPDPDSPPWRGQQGSF